jgi:signal transduction histidine kinase
MSPRRRSSFSTRNRRCSIRRLRGDCPLPSKGTVEARSGLQTEFQAEDDLQLTAALEEELYRIALEALNNVLKHAHATFVGVALIQNDKRLQMSIHDNGKGFDPVVIGHKRGWGLRGIAERVERLGGTCKIESQPGAGTRITVEVSQ